MEAAVKKIDEEERARRERLAQDRILAIRSPEQRRQDEEDSEVISIVRDNYERWRKAHPAEAQQAVPLVYGTMEDMPDEMIDDLPDTYSAAKRQFKRALATGFRALVGIACIVLAQQEILEPVAAAICTGCWWLSAAESWARK